MPRIILHSGESQSIEFPLVQIKGKAYLEKERFKVIDDGGPKAVLYQAMQYNIDNNNFYLIETKTPPKPYESEPTTHTAIALASNLEDLSIWILSLAEKSEYPVNVFQLTGFTRTPVKVHSRKYLEGQNPKKFHYI